MKCLGKQHASRHRGGSWIAGLVHRNLRMIYTWLITLGVAKGKQATL